MTLAPRLLLLGLGVFFLLMAVSAYQAGCIVTRRGYYWRQHSPAKFWAHVLMLVVNGLVFLLAALCLRSK